MRKIPMRTCVMCREKTDKRNLLRIVRTPEGEVKFDPTGKMNGRGAYVCDKEECINNIKNVKKISSALEVEADKQALERVVTEIKECLNGKRGGNV